MTALEWDNIGERYYETGIERGAIYTPNGDSEVWPGLISVTENAEQSVTSHYLDGIKYLDRRVLGSYAAKVQSFSYPGLLMGATGAPFLAPGVRLYEQPGSIINFTYRTLEGNDLDGLDLGYHLHLVWNVTATRSDSQFSTVNQSVSPTTFDWDLVAAPTQMFGIRPTSHISLNSAEIDADLLSTIEDSLYGTESTDPVWPDLVELLDMIEDFYG